VSDEPVFLGVDGGGTKTALCIIDRTGRRLAQTHAPSMYYFGADLALVEDVLRPAVAEICSLGGVSTKDIAHAFIGYPGYGEASADIPVLDALPLRVLGHRRYTCGNDMVCAWAGSLAAADGINVVSGTGSMAYGELAGRRARSGGWGELFGDEGSGYWIAARGLGAFSRMSDGRLDQGPLLAALRKYLDLSRDLDVIDVVLNHWQGNRRKLAALSKVVAEAAALGDRSAARILDESGIELAALAASVRSQLGVDENETVRVSYSGGVFKNEAVRSSFNDAIAELPAPYEVRLPLFDPVTGAALYAAKRAGMPLEALAHERLGA
jgi:N-acetylglucosamine kinase-like BadF-type ATPase